MPSRHDRLLGQRCDRPTIFVIERPIDHGLLEVLRSDVVPRLLEQVPHQPSEEQLEADPYRFRFVMVFDREGYSPDFFKEMWGHHRIDHKYPKDPWPVDWFADTEVNLPNGERVSMKLAEMGSWIGGRKNGLWVRQIRKLMPTGHQTSLISTAYSHLALEDAAALFSRWSQENFFRYMMEHYAIDALSEYKTEKIPETKRPVVNPPWRELDRQSRSIKAQLTQRQARFAALTLHPEDDEAKMLKWEKRKANLVEEIEPLENQLNEVKEQIKKTPKHVDWDQLPTSDQFERLAPSRKRLTDTVKMIAYRAETALVSIVREKLIRPDDARALVRDLFRSEADVLPDLKQGVLHVRCPPHGESPKQPCYRPSDRLPQRRRVHLPRHTSQAHLRHPPSQSRRYTRRTRNRRIGPIANSRRSGVLEIREPGPYTVPITRGKAPAHPGANPVGRLCGDRLGAAGARMNTHGGVHDAGR